jgi:signal transduction histidine kinase
MSCGTPMHSAEIAAESEFPAPEVVYSEVPYPDQARFYSDLATGLHAMAQPLTILRSAIEVLVLPAGSNIDQRRYLEISAKQLARTCGMFASLQDLVTARMIEAQRTHFNLWDLLTPLIEDQRRLLLSVGVGIAVACAEPSASICGDAERTEQALVALLSLAASLSSRGDVIELHAAPANGFVELTLENACCHGKRLDSSQRLSLSVAEANILSQHGRCSIVEDPFRVSLALPAEELVAVACEARLSHQDAQPMR